MALEDISIIINAYNFVMPVSTFPMALINLNYNLKNLYIYDLINYRLHNVTYTIYKMKPSLKYIKMMKENWKKTKEQLDLRMNEACINDTLIKIFPQFIKKI